MTTPYRWPTDDELSQLLQGRLSAPRQAEIEAILEQEEDLRTRLERIAGGSSWIGRAGSSASQDDNSGDDFALHAAMDGLKAQASDATIHQGVDRGSMTLAFLSPSDNPAALGKLLHYEVLELIGTGGFGLVLKAHDPKLNRLVAIKVLAPHLASHATARRRFTREAHTAASINHPHVVTIHAIEENERPPFLVMEYVAGQSLQQLLDRHGPLELPQLLRIGAQMSAGLAAAHKQGQIHRDVKPGNILLENGVQRVKITDFGLARAADDASLTQSGVIAGTPQYMAPEQARGENVDYRADLFSLGSVLYTMCTGRAAFRADSAVAVLKRVCDDQPRPIRVVNPEVPNWLAAIVERLMAKRRDERFQSAQEVCELLEKCLAHVQQPELVALPEEASRLARSTSTAQPKASATSTANNVPVAAVDRETLLEEAQRRVRIPAIGLIVVAVLNILMMGMFAMTTTTHVVYSNGEYVPRAAWLGMVSIVLTLFILAASVVLVLGGVSLQRLRAWPLVLIAAILSMMSISVLGLGLVFGLWTLVLLFDPRIQRAMRLSADETPESLRSSSLRSLQTSHVPPVASKPLVDHSPDLRNKVWWPATALLWVGVLNVASLAAMTLIFAMFASRGNAPVLILPVVAGILATGGAVIIAGAYYMRELRCWPLAVAAAILAMIIGPGSIIGLAVGIWALVVLMQADVRAAFAGRTRDPIYRNDDKTRQVRAVLLTIAAGFFLVMFTALLAVGGWVFTYRSGHSMPPPAPVPHAQLRVEADVSNVTVSVEQTNVFGGSVDQWRTSQDAKTTPFHVEMMIAPGNYTIRALDDFRREVFRRDIVLDPAEREVVQVNWQVHPERSRSAWPSKGYLNSDNVVSTALSADGKHAAWALKTHELVVCKTDDGREQRRFTISDPNAVAFSPDSKLIAFLGAEKDKAPASELRVGLYNLETQEVKFLPHTKEQPLENVRSLAFSPDGQIVVASVAYASPKQREVDADFKSGILRWKVALGEELPMLKSQEGIIQQIAFPAGIDDIAVSISNWPGKRGASIVCWNLEKGEAFHSAYWPDRIYDAVALTPQGGWVYASAYDPAQSQGVPPGPNISILATRDSKDRRGLFPEAGRIALQQRATALAISRDGKVLAFCSEPGKIELWLVHALRPVRLAELLGGQLGEHPVLRFTDNNRFLVASSANLQMTQWDVSGFTTLADQAEAPLPRTPVSQAASPTVPPTAPPPVPSTSAPTNAPVEAAPPEAEPGQPIAGAEQLDKLVELAQQQLQTMQDRQVAGLAAPDELVAAKLQYYQRLLARYEAHHEQAKVLEVLADIVSVRKESVRIGETLFEAAAVTQAEVDARRAALIEAELQLKKAQETP